jgi:CheY-like chemotaxis protein
VDDNADAADLLAQALRLMGHVVEVAHDGQAALEFGPDRVLLDIGLPIMDGYEVARRLRARAPHLLLVAITGYGQSSDVERAHEAGFDHHLVKPVPLEAVGALLATGLERIS